MVFVIALFATFNIGVGFVLGVYLCDAPFIPNFLRRKPADPPEPEVDLSTEENTPPPKPKKKKKKPAKEAEPPVEEDNEPAGPSTADIMKDLSSFQEQLASVELKMKDSVEDEEAFGEQANRLQQANHDYLEKTQTTLEELGDNPTDSAAECREVLTENTKRVEETSGEIDSLLAEGAPDEAARAELLEKTSKLGQIVEEASTEIEAQVEATAEQLEAEGDSPQEDTTENAEEPDTEEETPGLTTLEAVEGAIAEALESDGDSLFVAAIQRDPLEDLPEDEQDGDIESRLLTSLSELVGDAISSSQIFTPRDDTGMLIVLSGDSLEQASHRVEKLRREIEQTTFVADDCEFQATITCALAEAADDATREELMEQIEEALAESERHGTNRSYHHDGRLPAPLMPEEIEVVDRKIEI